MKSGTFKALVILVVVFVLGGIAGTGVTFSLMRRQFDDLAAHPWRAERARMHALSRKLDLSDAQRDKLKAIFDRHRGQRQALMRKMVGECGGAFRAEKDALDAEIRALLTPEQRTKFDLYAQEQNQRFWPPGPPPHGDPGPHRGPPPQ